MLFRSNSYNSEHLFIEESVSCGYHILFRTKEPLNINGKRLLSPDGDKVEVLWADHQTVNIAPTCSHIKDYKCAGDPEYRVSRRLSGSFDNIGFANTIKMRASINRLPLRLQTNTIIRVNQSETISEVDKMVLKYIHQYGKLSEIDKQIRLVYPIHTELLNYLHIKHFNNPNDSSIQFFSLSDDDGKKPGALLYHNMNNNKENKWPGYSVQDFHLQSDKPISFSKYLCKHAQPKFDRLMQKIGFGKIIIKAPIETVFSGKTIEIKYDQYISEEQYQEVLDHINLVIQNTKSKRQPRIVITAPTGVGKTNMFYQLAIQEKAKIILMLSYTSQVLQGKEQYAIADVMEGLCESDYRVPVTGSIFGTYDKAPIISKWLDLHKKIIIIDEGHNLVNQSSFRSTALKKLKILSDLCKAVIYMTATPDYINFKKIDLLIRFSPIKPKTKLATVVKYSKDCKNVMINIITNQHISGNIDVVYARNINKLEVIEHAIISKFPEIETSLLYAYVKNDSKVYDNLSKHQMLSGEGIFQNGGILFTTNLIVDGVNINDCNIGNVYLLDPDSTTDLVQFPSRFRKGYANYFIFISGNDPNTTQELSRQELVQKYYQMAFMQKRSYDNISKIINALGVITGSLSDGKSEIQLIKSYDLLDDAGDIQDETILLKVQKIEAWRMRWDVEYIKAYLETSEYNFLIDEKDVVNLSKALISKDEISKATISLADMKEQLVTSLKNILKDDLEHIELIKDYLKNKFINFKNLKNTYNIANHTVTHKHDKFLTTKICSKILFKYCIGLELGADDPMKMITFNSGEIDSIKRTWNNLTTEASERGIKETLNLFRYNAITSWIEDIRINDDDVIIDIDMLTEFIKDFNSKYAGVYKTNNIKNILLDLHDIYDVNKVLGTTNYVVGVKWTLNNIRGLTFTRSRR